MNLEEVRVLRDNIQEQVRQVVVGQEEVLDLMLVALLVEGHVLLEGVPGVAKTLLVRSFAATLSLQFNRIQFTPDLMPGDILGTNLFDFQTNHFRLTRGPIFTQLLLADEINRTPPKTQAALLQAMQERRVSLDGATHELGEGFMVVATQNPIEHEGTYPLPEAQLDRFLLKVLVGYPTRDHELELVRLHGNRTAMPRLEDFSLRAIADAGAIAAARTFVRTVQMSEEMLAYIVELVRATRGVPALLAGASPRAASMLAAAARGYAALQERDFVIPDDVKRLAVPVLAHRLVLAPVGEIEGVTANQVIAGTLEKVAAPR